MKKLFKKLLGKLAIEKKPVEESKAGVPGYIEMPPIWGETHEETTARFARMARAASIDKIEKAMGLNAVPPESVLGNGYGDLLHWTHKDDLFVDFQVFSTLVVDDVDFFMRYMASELTEEEKQKFSYIIHPCFAEITEVVCTHMLQPLQELNDDQRCLIVAFQNVLGVLLISEEDSVDIIRRSIGLEDETKKTHYQMQFMRFDDAVIKRLDLAGEVSEQYQLYKSHRPALRVNFANYNEIAIENE